MMSSLAKTSTALFRSISFSGAGFLACYHIGVTACLLQQGYLPPKGNKGSSTTILTGVSAGALTSAGVSAGVDPQDAMNVVIQVVRRTKKDGGSLDALWPGFSLVDQVEDLFMREMKLALGGSVNDENDYDLDLLQARIQGGKLLRIGLTNRNVGFPPLDRMNAYCYVDEYRNVDDILAACVLSSFIPGLTGPALGSKHAENQAVKRAMVQLKEMEQLGFVKNGKSGQPVNTMDKNTQENENDASREVYWDGGLVNVWPVIDQDTLVVTPVSGNFDPNPSICPQIGNQDDEDDSSSENDFLNFSFPNSYRINRRAEIYLCRENIDTMRRMALSSDENVLQDKFNQGYDDAKRFLDRNNLLNVYSTSAGTSESSTSTTGVPC